MLYVLRYPFAFLRTKADFFIVKRDFSFEASFHEGICLAWWLNRHKANGKISVFLRVRGFRAKMWRNSCDFQRPEGWFLEPLLWDEIRGNPLQNISRFRLLLSSAFSSESGLWFSSWGLPTASHASRIAVKWLKAVYIIPSTDTSKDETAKTRSTRRSLATSKTLRLAHSASNSKHFFHLLPTRNSFSPRFLCSASHTQNFLCASCCVLWK